jgi:hypothetical protein
MMQNTKLMAICFAVLVLMGFTYASNSTNSVATNSMDLNQTINSIIANVIKLQVNVGSLNTSTTNKFNLIFPDLSSLANTTLAENATNIATLAKVNGVDATVGAINSSILQVATSLTNYASLQNATNSGLISSLSNLKGNYSSNSNSIMTLNSLTENAFETQAVTNNGLNTTATDASNKANTALWVSAIAAIISAISIILYVSAYLQRG